MAGRLRGWQADPKDGSVLIFLAHNMADLAQMAKGIGLGAWGAVTRFKRWHRIRDPSPLFLKIVSYLLPFRMIWLALVVIDPDVIVNRLNQIADQRSGRGGFSCG